MGRLQGRNMEFGRPLVWHSAACSRKVKQEPSAGVFKKPTRENLSKVVPATLQTWACITYEGKCITPDVHPKEMHILLLPGGRKRAVCPSGESLQEEDI